MLSSSRDYDRSDATLFDRQYPKSPLLRDVHDFWTCSEEGRFCLHTFTELDSVEELADRRVQEQAQSPEQSVSAVLSPYDRFVDEGNERWFTHLYSPMKGKVSEISVSVASKICQEQIFQKDFDPTSFSNALQGIDYIDCIEYTRIQAVRNIGKKWNITDWTYGELLHGHPGPLNWIKIMKETDKMLNYHYAELWRTLRIWTMTVHLKYSHPFNKLDSVALLNTLFPPITNAEIIAPISKQDVLSWRSWFYDIILQMTNRESPSPGIDFEKWFHDGFAEAGPFRWSGVRKHLDSYFLLVKSAMSHIDEGLNIDYVPHQPRSFAVRPSMDNLPAASALRERAVPRSSASTSQLPHVPIPVRAVPPPPATGGYLRGSARPPIPQGVPQETEDRGAGLGIRQVPGVTPMIGHEDVTIAGRPYSQLPMIDEDTISVVPKKRFLFGRTRGVQKVKSMAAIKMSAAVRRRSSLPAIDSLDNLSPDATEQLRQLLIARQGVTPRGAEPEVHPRSVDVIEYHGTLLSKKAEENFDSGHLAKTFLAMEKEKREAANKRFGKAEEGANMGTRIKNFLEGGLSTIGYSN